jgi:hypothetical protein
MSHARISALRSKLLRKHKLSHLSQLSHLQRLPSIYFAESHRCGRGHQVLLATAISAPTVPVFSGIFTGDKGVALAAARGPHTAIAH